MSAADPLTPGTVVQYWRDRGDRLRGVPGKCGILAGVVQGVFMVQFPGREGTAQCAECLPMNAPELREEAERAKRAAWLAGRPARREAFIQFETSRALESGMRQAEAGLRFRYGVRCCRCSHVSRVPSDTWDHALQCRGDEPTRRALREVKP